MSLEDRLAPNRGFVEGRAALEMLDRDALPRAHQAFEHVLAAAPFHAAAHIGLASVSVLGVEAARVDRAPDPAILRLAEHHAREACLLDPRSGDAFSTLALVLDRIGDPIGAAAAARTATDLEPYAWRHWVSLAWVSWGSERLRAAYRALALRPGLAFAHWFVATVFVARGAFDPALEALREGCRCQDAQSGEDGRFNAVGLHYLHALVLAERGLLEPAFEELARELAGEDEGHVYGRECYANSWYAIGALHVHQHRHDEAEHAFHETLTRVPRHGLALAGLAAISRSPGGSGQPYAANAVDAAMVQAASLALEGKHAEGARVYCEALAQPGPRSAGWQLPADPLIRTTVHREEWAPALATLRDRAT
jgi:tetratricopeptide (TPR) repeat protein